ncbi:MAG: GGDEF domain-containing protein [Solirubrobacteraceae bacterium]
MRSRAHSTRFSRSPNPDRGRRVGSEVFRALVYIAHLLAVHSREIDITARLGGEEFAVLMPGSDREGAEAFAERVRHALAAHDCLSLPDMRVSAGVTATAVPIEVEMMLERVDSALCAAKRGGRDRTVAFDGHEMSVPV